MNDLFNPYGATIPGPNGTMITLIGGKGITIQVTGKNIIIAATPNNTDVPLTPISMPDSAASPNTVYFSTTANVLVYKDAGSVVHNLY